MLTQDEELWQKKLTPGVEELLMSDLDPQADRNFRCAKAGYLQTINSNMKYVMLILVEYAFKLYTWSFKYYVRGTT